MSKPMNKTAEPEIISLAEACRRVGICARTGSKLPPEEFPGWFWLGGKRVIARRRFESWLAEKTGVNPDR